MTTHIKISDHKLSVCIPFEGFYHSSHDDIINDVMENEVYYLKEDLGVDEKLVDSLDQKQLGAIDWRKVYIEYSKEYVEQLEYKINELIAQESALETKFIFKLEFEELNSPREYNFTTDRIFCKFDVGAIQYMYESVDTPKLREKITERFTSRSGFISFYPNTLEQWNADVKTWDANQLGVLLEVFIELLIECETIPDINEYLGAYNLMEDARGNGVIDEIVWGNATPEFMEELDKLRETK